MIEKDSLADYAARALKRIIKLSESQKISDKLLSLNLLFFVLILGVDIAYLLFKSFLTDSFIFLVILAISFIFSLIVSLGYGPVLEAVSNIVASDKKIATLRIAITILFTDLAVAVLGLTLNSLLLIYISLAVIGLQIVVIPFVGSFVTPKQVIEDKKVRPSQFWPTVGKIAAICGIISFIVQITFIALGILKII